MKKEKQLTDEQEWEIIWQKCLETEKQIKDIRSTYRDKGIDWEKEKQIYQLNDPRFLK